METQDYKYDIISYHEDDCSSEGNLGFYGQYLISVVAHGNHQDNLMMIIRLS